MRKKLTKLLFLPLILSSSFLFNYPSNAGMENQYRSQKTCTWSTADYLSKDGGTRYCIQPSGIIQTVSKGGSVYDRGGFINRELKDISSTGYIQIIKWKRERDQLVRYTCEGGYSSFECLGSVERNVVGYDVTKYGRYLEFTNLVKRGEITEVFFNPNDLTAEFIEIDGSKSLVNIIYTYDLIHLLDKYNVNVLIKHSPYQKVNPILQTITSLIFPIFFISILIILIKILIKRIKSI